MAKKTEFIELDCDGQLIRLTIGDNSGSSCAEIAIDLPRSFLVTRVKKHTPTTLELAKDQYRGTRTQNNTNIKE